MPFPCFLCYAYTHKTSQSTLISPLLHSSKFLQHVQPFGSLRADHRDDMMFESLKFMEVQNLEDLGYNSFFETELRRIAVEGVSVARVTSESRGAYRVRNIDGEYFAKITGKRMFNASSREDYPVVGDFVAIKILDKEQAMIECILPRATMMRRKFGDKNRQGEKDQTQIIAANVDVAFIVQSVGRDYNLNRFERYIAIAKSGGVTPVIVLNKTDLISREELNEKVSQVKERIQGVSVITADTVTSEGFNGLMAFIKKGKTYCFLGSSGVGKSSLINKLLGESVIRTGDIGSHSERGRHVTTNRQMYFLENGGIVIDNPGVREVALADADAGVPVSFDDIAEFSQNCRYPDCTHTHEPGCKVLEAVKSGKIDKEKYSNYVSLEKEAEYSEMNEAEKKNKDRRFGKFVSSAKKDLKKFRHKGY